MLRSFSQLTVLCVFLFLTSIAQASRSEPAVINSLTINGVEYRVPNAAGDHMGFIEAYDSGSNKLLWSRQIYVVVKNPNLESDVQDVFISKIDRDGDELVVTNEKGSVYRLNLTTLEIKIEKGKVREGNPAVKKQIGD